MEFILTKPIQVYDKNEGQYIDGKNIEVKVAGKKGLFALKEMQDIVFKVFAQQAKNNNAKEPTKKPDEKDITVDELLSVLEMTGSSATIFEKTTKFIQSFSTISGHPITDTIIDNDMDSDDLDNLTKEVLKHFLLPKIIRIMNSMNK